MKRRAELMEQDAPDGGLAGVGGAGLVLVQQKALYSSVEGHKQASLVGEIKVDRVLGQAEVCLEGIFCW